MRDIARYILIGVILLLPFGALAQGIPTSELALELSVSADNPVPGQNVTITARSFSDNISASTLVWTVDGKEVMRGIGKTTISVKAPALGKKSVISLVATTALGRVLRNNVTLGSGSVDLIMESSGYTHQSFLGKVAPAYENVIKVTAIPHLANSSGVEYDPKTLLYQWSKNDKVIEDQSGYGKQRVTVAGDLVPRAYTINIKVSSRDGNAQSAGTVLISPDTPSLLFYLDDQLYGPLFNKALQGEVYLGKQREAAVLAVPYGFDKPQTGLGNLIYGWSINGLPRNDLANNEAIILRAPEGSAGSSEIRLNIKNSSQITQGTLGGFSVFFSARTSEDADPEVRF